MPLPTARWWPLLGLGLLGLAVAVFYLPHLGRMPSGYHSWAQSDRLALALNFYDFGFNFFKPRTSSLLSIDGVTGVEFPLQAYLAALGGLLTGRENINANFRLLDALLTLVGFYYLFRLVFDRTRHFVAALVPGCFLLASPVFAFYAGNYLPDPASLSLSFVGYYYWLRFFDHRRFRDLAVGVGVLTLAALLKTTVALHLAAVLSITVGWACIRPALLTARQRAGLAALCVAGVGAVGLFFYHNQQLNATYQSQLFLAKPQPIQDPKTLADVLGAVQYRWWYEYASEHQYWMLKASAVLFVVLGLVNLRRHLALTLLVLAAGLIGYAFFWLMGAQLIVHDYYIIASFIPPAVLLLVLALLNVGRWTGVARWATSAGLLLLCGVLLRGGHEQLQARMQEDTFAWLQEAPEYLRGSGVRPDALALALVEQEPGPNTMLVRFDRRGLVWPTGPAAVTPDALVAHMAPAGLEYAVMSAAYYAGLSGPPAAWAGAFEPVLTQPFVVLRRRDMPRAR